MRAFSRALIFATKAHGHQKRKDGSPYIVHPIRVSQEVATEQQKVIALLHDVLEDTEVTIEDLIREFGGDVALSVELLTRGEGQDYDEYITDILHDPDAVAVKIADICDNLGDSPSAKAIERSSAAIARLLNQ